MIFRFDPVSLAREIFELELPVKRSELKSRYRKLARKFHPDRGGTDADFIAVQKAYETLLAFPELVFSDELRKGRALCGACNGTGYVFWHDDHWKPRRPCFVCFACRMTLGCEKCDGRFRVKKSARKAFIACQLCRGAGDTRETKLLNAKPKELVQ